MTEYSIDPITWFGERKMLFTPSHFTISNTPLTPESNQWLLNNLTGRYSIVNTTSDIDGFLLMQSFGNPAFEDPREAVIYELTWS